jgi:hypothetical protein
MVAKVLFGKPRSDDRRHSEFSCCLLALDPCDASDHDDDRYSRAGVHDSCGALGQTLVARVSAPSQPTATASLAFLLVLRKVAVGAKKANIINMLKGD